jgi:hypothetical protein
MFGSKSTMPRQRPSNSTPNGRPSSARRPRSTATTASTSAANRRRRNSGFPLPRRAATWGRGPSARNRGEPPRRQP